MILIVTLIAVASTYFITSDSSKVFKSTARLETGILNNPKDEGKYVPEQKIDSRFNNLKEVMYSRAVIDLLSYKLALRDLNASEPFRNVDNLRSDFSADQLNQAIVAIKIKQDTLGTLSYSITKDAILIQLIRTLGYDYDALRKNLKVDRIKGSDFLEVEFVSENPELSAFVVNSLCDEFIRYYRSIRSERKNSSVAFYNEQVDEKRRILSERKEALNQFKLNNGIVNYHEQTSAILKQIRDLEIGREEEKKRIPSYKQAIKNLDRNQLEGSESFSEIQAKNKTINNLRSEINYLNDKYISSGSKDKRLLEQIEKLKSELRDEINSAASSPSNTKNDRNDLVALKVENEMELEIAISSVLSIEKEIQRLNNELAVFVSLEPQVSAFESEIMLAQKDYEDAVNKLSLSRTESLLSDDQLTQVQFGRAAESPEPTKQLFFSLFSGILSLSFCIVVIFVLEYVDLSIKTPTQFEKYTDLNLLGYMNQINFISFDLDVNFIDINLESIFHNKTDNKQLESFKQLIRKIRFEVESADAKRFLVTSTREKEGKTFLLISLAYSLSLNNKRVLLIDTNFKNNTLSTMLSAKPSLEKHFNDELVKTNIISKTKLKGLDIIGCYEGSYSPSEVFSQTNFHDLINKLSENYDFIFLEGAALNEYSDSKELVSSVEKIIAVFSTNTVIKDEDKASIAYLRGLGEKFMGAVLNKVDLNNLS